MNNVLKEDNQFASSSTALLARSLSSRSDWSQKLYLLVLVCFLLLVSACNAAPAKTTKVEAAHVEAIKGSDFKRVVLSEKAAQRLDIQTVQIHQESRVRQRKVGGQIEAFPGTTAASGVASDTVTAMGGMLVRVRLNESDIKTVDIRKQVKVLPIVGTGGAANAGKDDVMARAVSAPAGSDNAEDEDVSLYYEFEVKNHGMTEGQRVLVELSLLGSSMPMNIIPYAAVIYGLNGETWVYARIEPLTYVRMPVKIDYIEGDQAILSESPATETEVVVVGVAELFGVESGVGGGH